jgi:hypothetical protein
MNQPSQIPDPETRMRSLARWREVNQQIDLLTLQLDELIAMVEVGLREQRLVRLQCKARGKIVTKVINK